MTIIKKTVSGKTLTAFVKYNGTSKRQTARHLLGHDDAVSKVEEGGGGLTVWIRQDELHWTAPRGWQIEEVSLFTGQEWQDESGAVAVDIVPEGDA